MEMAAEELQRSERLMRAVFTGASDAMALLDAEGRFIDVNPAACALFGRAKAKLQRGRLADHTRNAEAILLGFAADAAPTSRRGRHVIRRADGEARIVDFAATPNIGVDLHLLALRDVTDERAAAESLARTEVELRRSDARFKALVEKSAEAIALISGEGLIVYITRHSRDMLGVDPEELLGERAFHLAHPDDRGLVVAAFERVVETGGATEQFRMVQRDGAPRWVEAILTNLLADPDIQAIVINIRDVTAVRLATCEREQLIKTLTFERARLGTLFENAPSFMAVLRGTDLVFELANRQYHELFVGGREILGKKFADAFPEFVAQGFVAKIEAVMLTGVPWFRDEQRVDTVMPDGSTTTRMTKFRVQPIVESDGTRSGVFIHGIDVTDEADAKRRTEALFKGVPVPTYAFRRVDIDGQKELILTDFNDAATRLPSTNLPVVRGRPASDILKDLPTVLSDLEGCIDRGEIFRREVERPLKGQPVPRRLLVTYAPAPPDMAIAHVEDITDHRLLEEQLRQSQKMEAIGRLAGGVAHDFNNLLSVVLSYTSLLMGDLAATHPMYADLEQIQQAGHRAVELTRQLLAFSRQQVMQARVMSVSDTITGMEKMLRRLLGEDVELELRTAPDANVKADRGQIEQVIMNLVINARDAMPEGGQLVVETTETANEVTLAVTDDGVGMDDDTRARIFEPFFTTKGAGKGTGLGLATVFGIVQQSGGTISVRSKVGEGTTIAVRLPRVRSLVAGPVSSKQTTVRGGTETILVVEDETPLRKLAVTILKRAGYDVIDAHDGQAAIEVAEACSKPIHLLLTDVVMPRMNGRQVSDRLSATRVQMKTLFMSGYTDDAAVLQRVLASKAAFLQKPITPETLLAKVRKVLDDGGASS